MDKFLYTDIQIDGKNKAFSAISFSILTSNPEFHLNLGQLMTGNWLAQAFCGSSDLC